jgi:hypothetical protein
MSKMTFSNREMVNLGGILGGDVTTLLSVSRIEVRDGIISCPVMVVSQYRLFCDC